MNQTASLTSGLLVMCGISGIVVCAKASLKNQNMYATSVMIPNALLITCACHYNICLKVHISIHNCLADQVNGNTTWASWS